MSRLHQGVLMMDGIPVYSQTSAPGPMGASIRTYSTVIDREAVAVISYATTHADSGRVIIPSITLDQVLRRDG